MLPLDFGTVVALPVDAFGIVDTRGVVEIRGMRGEKPIALELIVQIHTSIIINGNNVFNFIFFLLHLQSQRPKAARKAASRDGIVMMGSNMDAPICHPNTAGLGTA